MKSAEKIIIYMTGTGLWTGYAPFAPGTAGSLLALLLYYFIPGPPVIWFSVTVLITLTGVYVATRIEQDKGHDPSLVVIDEMAGLWISLLFLPRTFFVLIVGFVLFRIFDIWKPYPISVSQNLPGGWGIMMDDVIAGIYANVLIQLLVLMGWVL